jgi:UDP-N-acetylmuramyl pentapeptide phosphotransferase/UDP-N-acetylglucosamine-1-phosphate transferase
MFLDLGWAGGVLDVLYLVWLLNLYNVMDGIDGIAGVEAVTVCLGALVLCRLSVQAGGGDAWAGRCGGRVCRNHVRFAYPIDTASPAWRCVSTGQHGIIH